jgi:hypothetical protein
MRLDNEKGRVLRGPGALRIDCDDDHDEDTSRYLIPSLISGGWLRVGHRMFAWLTRRPPLEAQGMGGTERVWRSFRAGRSLDAALGELVVLVAELEQERGRG